MPPAMKSRRLEESIQLKIRPAENFQEVYLHFVHMHPRTIEDDARDQHRPVDRAWDIIDGAMRCASCLRVLFRAQESIIGLQ